MENEEALAAFKREVSPLVGVDLGAYKDRQMERRITAMMSRANVQSLPDYLEVLKTEPRRLQDFIDGLTINVSEWFRNAEKFDVLREQVLPQLLDRFQRLRIWSAGCSIGSEIYSVAMILREMGVLDRCELIGTDLDDKALDQARRAVYAPHEQTGLTPEVVDRYFERLEGGNLRFSPELADHVRWSRQNLLADRFDTGFHLIICRNVVIYFNEASKSQLYAKFHAALVPGGMLFVGSTERIFHYRDLGFDQSRPFFYVKR